MSDAISHEALMALMDSWISQGRAVAGPVALKSGLCLYLPIVQSKRLRLDTSARPRNSIKEFLFPKHETLCTFAFDGKDVEVADAPLPETETILCGVRPCDAASLPIMDRVFQWDDTDPSYAKRRELTTVVTLACTRYDVYCTCTTFGYSPSAHEGSDVLLVPYGDGHYEVFCLTEKGENLFNGAVQPLDESAPVPTGPDKRFDTEPIQAFLRDQFDAPVWSEIGARCMSCGACAHVCPTCHCFDIVDEGNATTGRRVRNWDSCQFAMFTMHASGHNPRSDQAQRQRQRIQHKFRMYPERFGSILCTGCGNCTRNCPAGLGVLHALATIDETIAISQDKANS